MTNPMEEMMKMAQAAQEKMAAAQAKVETLEADGVSGGGLVMVTLCNGAIKRVFIDKSLLKADEGEVLEDLIMAAHNAAKTKLDQLVAEEMKSVTAGLPIPPGMKLPF
jgi:DNA-binding YbaB/EbfC family protein